MKKPFEVLEKCHTFFHSAPTNSITSAWIKPASCCAPNYVTKHFSWVINKYNLKKIRYHDLRHPCASLLPANGMPMKQIQILLGHSTFSTSADIYAHLDYSAHQEYELLFGTIFEKSSSAKPCELK